jgi:hypothetical protein
MAAATAAVRKCCFHGAIPGIKMSYHILWKSAMFRQLTASVLQCPADRSHLVLPLEHLIPCFKSLKVPLTAVSVKSTVVLVIKPCRDSQTFQTNMLPPSSVSKSKPYTRRKYDCWFLTLQP